MLEHELSLKKAQYEVGLAKVQEASKPTQPPNTMEAIALSEAKDPHPKSSKRNDNTKWALVQPSLKGKAIQIAKTTSTEPTAQQVTNLRAQIAKKLGTESDSSSFEPEEVKPECSLERYDEEAPLLPIIFQHQIFPTYFVKIGRWNKAFQLIQTGRWEDYVHHLYGLSFVEALKDKAIIIKTGMGCKGQPKTTETLIVISGSEYTRRLLSITIANRQETIIVHLQKKLDKKFCGASARLQFSPDQQYWERSRQLQKLDERAIDFTQHYTWKDAGRILCRARLGYNRDSLAIAFAKGGLMPASDKLETPSPQYKKRKTASPMKVL
ncbi:hypothetical protein FH972_003433 [Carpinus fangiana]|uniref:Uncharacterized protein n=1 Tax=Carpinus fangiana TaxID=176857 RepID=A0A5N6QLD0_9ROSI|nr:hypothetical protein FH972_003433 [Carpinus fangiana]